MQSPSVVFAALAPSFFELFFLGEALLLKLFTSHFPIILVYKIGSNFRLMNSYSYWIINSCRSIFWKWPQEVKTKKLTKSRTLEARKKNSSKKIN